MTSGAVRPSITLSGTKPPKPYRILDTPIKKVVEPSAKGTTYVDHFDMDLATVADMADEPRSLSSAELDGIARMVKIGNGLPGGASDDRQVKDVLLWAGAAAGSGIIGQVAYVVVKDAIVRLSAKFRKAPADLSRDLGLIARLSVQARSAEVEIDVPRLEDLRVEAIIPGEASYLVTVHGPGMRATVQIPHGDLESARLEVSIYSTV